MHIAKETVTERVMTMITPTELEEINDIRFSNREKSRSALLRRLILKGLEAERAAS